MSEIPDTPNLPNQNMIELIMAIKGLAQAVEFMHSDLVHRIEEAGRDRNEETKELRELLTSNSKDIAATPVAVTDRLQVIIDRLESNIDDRVDGVLDDVRVSLNGVRQKLWFYLKEKEKDKEKSERDEMIEDTKSAVVRAITENEKTQTGKIELSKDGDIRLEAKFNWKSLLKLVHFLKWGGIGAAGLGAIKYFVDWIRSFF